MIYKLLNIKDLCHNIQLYSKAYSDMSPERQHKANRYKNPEDKYRCVFADMLLRDILREYFNISAPAFYSDEKGKPHLVEDKLHFSLSHQGDYVACAVDEKPVGIDIGQIRKVELPLINRVCTEDELCYVLGSSEETNDKVWDRFMRIWTAKEAYLKYTGEGITGGLKSVSLADKEGIKKHPAQNLILQQITEQDYICTIVSEI